jgi:DNA polymerase-1
MSTATVTQTELSILTLPGLRRLLRETAVLGIELRLSGSEVHIEGAERLPADLRAALLRYRDNGMLFDYLDGDAGADAASSLLEQLRVTAGLVETRAEARDAVRQLIRDHLAHPGPIGIDLETTPRPPYRRSPPPVRLNKDGALSALQPIEPDSSGLSPHTARIAILQLHAGGRFSFIFRGEALAVLLASHWLRRQWLVAHNSAFETAFLRHHTRGYRPPPHRRIRGRMECSMQGAGLLLGTGFGGGRSLVATSKALLGLDVDKDERLSDWGADQLSRGQVSYAAADAVLPHRLWRRIADELARTDRGEAYALQRGAVIAVAEMELMGLALDRASHSQQTDAWSQEVAVARRLYQSVTGQPPPSTPNDVRAWLTEVLDSVALERWPCTETGQLSTRSSHLKRLVHIPTARPVLAILAHEKLLRSFGTSLLAQINPATGRLHAHYNIAAAKAGRFSWSNPNLQQLPSRRAPEFRRCIVAANGYVLVGCDWNQIELRAAAWISGDPALLALYAAGRDLHREIAAQLSGVPLELVTKEQRQAAKAVAFGSLYGIGPRSLAENAFVDYGVVMSEAEAKQALNTFFQRFNVLNRWRREHAELCQARGLVRIGAGRVVEAAWEPDGQITFPQACNLPIQGICADAMLRALALVHRQFLAANIRGGIVATVHDELLAEVAEADAERARALLQDAMTEAFVTTFPGAPTTGVAAARIGHTWLEAKD